jgi:hypothetical protein
VLVAMRSLTIWSHGHACNLRCFGPAQAPSGYPGTRADEQDWTTIGCMHTIDTAPPGLHP